jgi:hypothetical protein
MPVGRKYSTSRRVGGPAGAHLRNDRAPGSPGRKVHKRCGLTAQDMAFEERSESGVHSGISRRRQSAELTEVFGGTGRVGVAGEREQLTGRLGSRNGRLGLGKHGAGTLGTAGTDLRRGRRTWLVVFGGCRGFVAARSLGLRAARTDGVRNRRGGGDRFCRPCGCRRSVRRGDFTTAQDRGENDRQCQPEMKYWSRHEYRTYRHPTYSRLFPRAMTASSSNPEGQSGIQLKTGYSSDRGCLTACLNVRVGFA